MELQPVVQVRIWHKLSVRLFHSRAALRNACHTAVATGWADRRGATALVTAVLIVAALATIGLAVDATRLVMDQTRLKTAVYAAGLVAARDINISGSAQNAINLFWANFQGTGSSSSSPYLNATATVTVTPVSSTTVQVQANATVPTTFMSLLGISSIPVSNVTQATQAATGVEVSLVLDNTGSMAGWPIQSVVTSATELVNILYGSGSQDTQPNLWVAVVPFTAEVNIGTANAGWLKTGSNITSAY